MARANGRVGYRLGRTERAVWAPEVDVQPENELWGAGGHGRSLGDRSRQCQ
jgi:hypothetical protein